MSGMNGLDHLYNSTLHCGLHLNESLQKEDHIGRTLNILIYKLENLTAECEENVCLQKTMGWYNLYVIFWLVALVFGLMGNVLVIVAFIQTKTLRKSVTNFFVTSLAVSDLLVVVFIMPIKIHQALHNQGFCTSLEVCKIYYTTDVTFFVASITNLFAVTVDRYIAITMPYRYQKIMKPYRAKMIIALVWIYGVIWGLLVNYNPNTKQFDAVYTSKHECLIRDKDIFYAVNYVLVFFVPSFIMLLLYIIILRISISHAKHIDETSLTRRGSNDSNKLFQSSAKFFSARRLELRATKLVCIVYGTFIVCWLPLTVLTLSHITQSLSNIPSLPYIVFGEMLPLINSTLNPFIYGLLHRDFKKALKRILGITYLEQRRKLTERRRSANDSIRMSSRYSYVSTKSHVETLSPTSQRLDTPRDIPCDTPRVEEEEEFTLHLPDSVFQNGSFNDCSKSTVSDKSNKSALSNDSNKSNESTSSNESKPLMSSRDEL